MRQKRLFRVYINARHSKNEKTMSLTEIRVFIACSVKRNVGLKGMSVYEHWNFVRTDGDVAEVQKQLVTRRNC
jgi:hypothetical protein